MKEKGREERAEKGREGVVREWEGRKGRKEGGKRRRMGKEKEVTNPPPSPNPGSAAGKCNVLSIIDYQSRHTHRNDLLCVESDLTLHTHSLIFRKEQFAKYR